MAFYKHVKIHSTVKPFFCELCGYRAVRKDNVQQHVRKVHKVEDSAVHVFKDGKFKYEAVERKKQEELEKLCGVVQDPSKKEEGDNAKIS